MGVKWIRLAEWGGQNDYASRRVLAPHQSPEQLNVRLTDMGFLQKRPGRTPFGADYNLVNLIPRSLFRAYCSETASGTQMNHALIGAFDIAGGACQVMPVDDTTGEPITDGGDILATPTNLGDTSLRMRCVQWKNSRVYMCFGDANNALRWGLDYENPNSPSTARTANDIGPPIIDATGMTLGVDSVTHSGAICTEGYHRIVVTGLYGPSGEEWAESARSTIVVQDKFTASYVTNEYRYKLTDIPDVSPACGQKKLYMTDGYNDANDVAVAEKFYFATLDAATTSLIWDEDDYPIQFGFPAPTTIDKGQIPDLEIQFMEAHNGRLYMVTYADRTKVWYSNLDKPDEVGIYSNFGIRYPCTGFKSFMGSLVIGTRPSIYVQRGWSPKDYQSSLEEVIPYRGVAAPDSMVVLPVQHQTMMFFVADDGIYAFDQQRTHFVGREVHNTFRSIPEENRADIQAVGWEGLYIMQYKDADGAYKFLVFDTDRGTWHPWDGMNTESMCLLNGPDDFRHLIMGITEGSSNYIRRFGVGYEVCDLRYTFPVQAPAGDTEDTQFSALKVEIQKDHLPLKVSISVDGANADTITLPAPDPGVTYPHGTYGDFTYSMMPDDIVCVETSLGDQLVGRQAEITIHQSDALNKKVQAVYLGVTGRGRSLVS